MKLILFVALSFLAIPSGAQAHAFLDHSEPKVGSEVSASPEAVKAWFTEAIEPAFSHLSVLDSSGKEVDAHDAHIDASDKTLFCVSVPALPAGTYKVVWAVVASDTHRTQGDFTFTIKP